MSRTRPTTVDLEGGPVKLELYKFDSCPFCHRVFRAIERLGLSIPMRDTLRDPGARSELIRLGGKSQVPALRVDGTVIYESRDIIRFLEKNIRSGVPDVA